MPPLQNEALESWVLLVAAHVRPSKIHWCDGSLSELRQLEAEMVRERVLIALDPERYPHAFLHRSDANDGLGLEHRTFISTPDKAQVGPTNLWLPDQEAYRTVWPLFARSMQGRTLFVVPYLLGPADSKQVQVGVQLTDSPFVVANLRILTRMGRVALEHLGRTGDFVRSVHSLGDLSVERRCLVHFPATQTVWSIGSGCADSAFIGHKPHALRIASAQAPEEGYLAENMCVIGVTNPQGKKHFIAAAFAGGSGKTDFANLRPSLPGWTLELVADDMCWIRIEEDGRLWAINPAAGSHGVVNGISKKTHPRVWAGFGRGAIFTNVGLCRNGTPWWEGMGEPPGPGMVDWQGQPWTPNCRHSAAHPSARFTARAWQPAGVGAAAGDPKGVPISAIIFGTRRKQLAPLVYEAMSWEHGVYMGATLAAESRSEPSNAPNSAAGAASVRYDPMAMRSFCGYDMADYLTHWLRVGRQLLPKPRIFHVNWFREDARGRLLWPGFGDNVRILDWIFNRIERCVDARSTPIGLVPRALDTSGLGLGPAGNDALHEIDVRAWAREVENNQEFLARFGRRLPAPLRREHEALAQRLEVATN